MKQDFANVYTAFAVKDDMKASLPAEQIEKIVKRELAKGMANFILENMEKLPAEIMSRDIMELSQTEYVLRINLISNDEIRRLRDIERDYFRLIGEK